MDGVEYNDLVMIHSDNVDIVYGGSQELKTIKLKISSKKSKKMKKVDTGKNSPTV